MHGQDHRCSPVEGIQASRPVVNRLGKSVQHRHRLRARLLWRQLSRGRDEQPPERPACPSQRDSKKRAPPCLSCVPVKNFTLLLVALLTATGAAAATTTDPDISGYYPPHGHRFFRGWAVEVTKRPASFQLWNTGRQRIFVNYVSFSSSIPNGAVLYSPRYEAGTDLTAYGADSPRGLDLNKAQSLSGEIRVSEGADSPGGQLNNFAIQSGNVQILPVGAWLRAGRGIGVRSTEPGLIRFGFSWDEPDWRPSAKRLSRRLGLAVHRFAPR
jgi:hypothetical protein